jgi:hypothetical protein
MGAEERLAAQGAGDDHRSAARYVPPGGCAARGTRDAQGPGCVIVADELVEDEFTAPASLEEQYHYAWSVVACLPAVMGDPDTAATGAMMRPATLRRYALEAGFQGLEILPVEAGMLRLYRLVTTRLAEQFADAGDDLPAVQLDVGHELVVRQARHAVLQVEPGGLQGAEVRGDLPRDGFG